MWDPLDRKLRLWLPLALNGRRETIGALSNKHLIDTQTLFPHRLINLIRLAVNWQ
jgi:hypothetical protein